MLEKIKNAIKEQYALDSSHGLFLSWFDKDDALVLSHGVLETDKPLLETIDLIYQWLFIKHEASLHRVIVDIVLDVVQESDLKKIVWYDPSHYGFAVISDDTRGVILPNTAGVSTAKDALSMLKNKHDITGKAYIYVFETMRLSVL